MASSTLAPLGQKTFRSLWLANIAGNFGGLIQGVGAAWLMTSLADSVDMVALVQASTTLPIMLFSLLGGTIADSFDRRRVMLAAQGFMLLASASLAVAAFAGVLSPWVLLGFTFTIGCGTALNNPSWQASVGDIVPREDLPSAVALNSIGFNLARSVGPAIGGAIVAIGGAAAAFAVNTVSYLGLIAALWRWQPNLPKSIIPREAMAAAMLSGLRYVALSPNICTVLLRGFLFGFSGIVVMALLPVVSNTVLGGGPILFGVMLGCFGIGAIGGALASGRMHRRLTAETIVRIAFIGFAISAFVTGTSTTPWLTGPALLLGGACWVLALSLFNVSVQLASPRWVVGRALSLYQTAAFGGMALGSWAWGLAAEAYGLQLALGSASLLLLAGAAVGIALPLPARTAPNLDPAGLWREPQLKLEVLPRSGPIRVQISYKIRTENVPAFLAAMAHRKRIRQRNGARDWTLMDDLSHPEIWTETYRTPTWTEYLRHNYRITRADADVGDLIRALHEGPDRPLVQRFIERQTNFQETLGGTKNTIDPP